MTTNLDTTSSPFRMIVLMIFMGFAGIGMIMFALYKATGTADDIGTVNVWGTIPESQFAEFLNELSFSDRRVENINYRFVPKTDFDTTLVNALASGRGPDMILLTNEHMLRHGDRVFITPYEQYDARSFKDTYIEAAESLLLPQGIIGFPLLVDPLVLYWNRSILSANHYAIPPKQWGELFKMSKKITKKDESGNIELATIALGEFTNIEHAKDIYVAILTQLGGAVARLDENGQPVSTLGNRGADGTLPAQDALRFYTTFADPTKSIYTWNKAQKEARDAFVAGDLAMYVGYASELPVILEQNPNLNFDVAPLPQTPIGAKIGNATIARVFTLAIPRIANNVSGAGVMLGALTTKQASELLEKHVGLPSVRRDLLAVEPSDPLKTTFRNSAIIAKSWPDPYPEATYNILKKMVESVTSGKMRMSEAINRAHGELQALLGR